jgi:selenocysteine lyase/cysteine desulfurase
MAIKGIMSDGGHMIISSIEHNSVSRPAYALFQQGKIDLSCADAETDPDRTVENFRSLIRSDTKAIVCTAAGNVTGQIMPLRPIARLCREKGICFIVDGAQACGVLPLTLEDGFNILCTAGHKGLYGITGTGLLISDGQFTIKPMIQGGTGSSSSLLTQPELLPEALESGTLNTPGIMSLKAGIDFVRRQGIDNIKEHEDRLCRIFIDGAKEIPGMTVYRSPGAEYVPIVSFNISSASPEKTAAMLAKQGFCLRAGYHCAALAHASLGTKQGTVRFSPSVFSREEDVHRLLRLLRSIQENRSDL